MYTKTVTTQVNANLWRTVAGVTFFVFLTALSAKITFNIGPVPITMQPLAVMLCGLVLGAKAGAAAQISYLSLIAMGFGLDARALGPAVFFGPTAGYLLGFAPAAYVAGWLAEGLSVQSWWGNFVAAVAGMLTIYLVGTPWLALYLGDWQTAITAGLIPFIFLDLGKAFVAAGVAESGKYWLNR